MIKRLVSIQKRILKKIFRINKSLLPFVLGLLVILLPLIYLNLFRPGTAEASWYNDNWTYRQRLSFGNTGGEVNNQKVLFDIDTSTLITNGQLQSSCQDIRFTDINGKLLPHYLDSAGGACNTASTDFYVLFSTIVGGDDTVAYIYYGNPSAPSASEDAQFSESTFVPTSGPTSATAEQGKGPVLVWKFDERNGTTAQDTSSYDNSGTITGATRTFLDSTCQDYGCLSFDGTGDYVTRADDADLDFAAADSFTVQAWINHAAATETDVILAKWETAGADGGYILQMESDGDITFGIDDDNTGPTDTVTSTAATYDDGNWHMVTGVKNGTSTIYLYIDGVEIGSTTVTETGTLANNDAFYVGVESDGTTNVFNGLIDEVKVYPYARTAEEVLTDYRQAVGTRGSSSVLGAGNSTLHNNTLVGYWDFNDNTGTGIDVVTDKSGNGNDGDTNNMEEEDWRPGDWGSYLDFDGTDEFVDLDDTATLAYDTYSALTVMAWVKTDIDPDTDPDIFYAHAANGTSQRAIEFGIDDSPFRFFCSTNNGDGLAEDPGTIETGTWYHVACIWTSSTSLALYKNGVLVAEDTSVEASLDAVSTSHSIGSRYRGSASDHFDGGVDELMIFSSALSIEEIDFYRNGMHLYTSSLGETQGGSWTFDQGTGDEAYDSSTNRNDGDLGGSSFACPGGTNCPTWTDGKYYKGLDFDGTNDNVVITADGTINMSNRNEYSVCGWINPDSDGEGNAGEWWSKGNSYVRVDSESTGEVNVTALFDLSTVDATLSPSNTISLNEWTHICVTYTDDIDDEISMYFNGVLVGTSTNGEGSLADDSSSDMYIGGDSTNNFDGTIDEVRVYLNELDLNAVQVSMNRGAVANFGGTSDDEDDLEAGSGNDMAGWWTFDENGGTVTKVVFTTTGITEWSVPSGISSITVKAWGAGGGGGGGGSHGTNGQGGDGGGGGFSQADISVTGGEVLNIHVGGAGGGGTAVSGGGSGGGGGGRSEVERDSDASVLLVAGAGGGGGGGDNHGNGSPGGDGGGGGGSTGGAGVTSGDAGGGGGGTQVTGGAGGTGGATNGTSGALESGGDGGDNNAGTQGGESNGGTTNGGHGGTGTSTLGGGGGGGSGRYGGGGGSASEAGSSNRGGAGGGGGGSNYLTGTNQTNSQATGSTPPNTTDEDYDGGAGTGGAGGSPCSDTSCPGSTGNDGRIVVSYALSVSDYTNNSNSAAVSGTITEEDWVIGKVGSAFDFDGVDDVAEVAADSAINLTGQTGYTVCAWIWPRSDGEGNAGEFWSKGNSYLRVDTESAGTVEVTANFDLATSDANLNSTTTIPVEKWSHVCAGYTDDSDDELTMYINGVVEGSSSGGSGSPTNDSSSSMYIGGDSSNNFDGRIDDVRVWTYERNQQQISYTYNNGFPVGIWRLDDCQGAIAYDSSGYRNNGTISDGGAGTNTAEGTCNSGNGDEMWDNGTSGKINSSLDFDGTDDVVTVTNATEIDLNDALVSEFSISFWIYPNSDGENDVGEIFNKGTNTYCRTDSQGISDLDLECSLDLATTDATLNITDALTINTWAHITLVWEDDADDEITIYKNGVPIGTSTDGEGAAAADSNNLLIGGSSSANFDGKIDDFRVYNYMLSQKQIRKVMLNDSGAAFAPESGQPQ